MDIALPAIPAGVLVLLAFFAPYLVAFLNGVLPFIKQSWQRKIVTIVVSLVLGAIVLVFYYVWTGDEVPAWPAFVVLALLVASSSYALVTKSTADRVEKASDPTEPSPH